MCLWGERWSSYLIPPTFFLMCLFFLNSDLAVCMFLELYPFPLGCLIHWHATANGILLWFFFAFLLYQLIFIFCNFLFCLFRSTHFSSWWAWLKVYQFYFSFQKNQLLVSLIFTIAFLKPLWFLLFPSFYWLFSSLIAGLLVCLRVLLFLE